MNFFYKGISLVLTINMLFYIGCASIIHGRHQNVHISSVPARAEASIDGHRVITPTTISLRRDQNYSVVVEKEGYSPARADIRRKFDWFWSILGNAVFGGLIGLAIDAGSGACWKLSPDKIEMKLEKAER